MKITELQILLIGFVILMMYSLFLHWKRHEISKRVFVFWGVIFAVFVFLTVFPKILEPILKELFIVRLMDLAMIGSFMILTYLTIENNIKIKSLDRKIEMLVRKISIKKTKLK
jgi:hypothetical protein